MNKQTVTGFNLGFTNTGRYPYVLAVLSCGHATRVELRPTVGRCTKCGLEQLMNKTGATVCPLCNGQSFSLSALPNPHVEADRLTKIGDVVDCETCNTEDEQIAWLDALDISTVHHSRQRYSSYYFYRFDATSPSGFMLIGGVMVSPRIEAKLREKRLSPLSPTEQA